VTQALLDTVVEGVSGIFFDDPTVEGLNAAIERFETDMLDNLDQAAILEHAQSFNEARFQAQIQAIIDAEVLAMKAGS